MNCHHLPGSHTSSEGRCLLCACAEFAREEISDLELQLATLEGQLRLLLLPRDPLDERDVMLEIR